jgi:hypothetical protein
MSGIPTPSVVFARLRIDTKRLLNIPYLSADSTSKVATLIKVCDMLEQQILKEQIAHINSSAVNPNG